MKFYSFSLSNNFCNIFSITWNGVAVARTWQFMLSNEYCFLDNWFKIFISCLPGFVQLCCFSTASTRFTLRIFVASSFVSFRALPNNVKSNESKCIAQEHNISLPFRRCGIEIFPNPCWFFRCVSKSLWKIFDEEREWRTTQDSFFTFFIH